MGHHFENGRWYVDTEFMNKCQGLIPGSEMKHLGFGEFYLETPDGQVDFDRGRGKRFEGQSGRSHWAYDNKHGKLVEKLVDIAERKGKSERLASQVLRIASDLPKGDTTRRALLEAIRTAYGRVKGSGGLLFSFDRGFSVQTPPMDSYGQVYDVILLMESGPKRPYRAALNVIREYKTEIMKFRKLWDVRDFIDDKVREQTGKVPKWHSYSMPD